MIEYRCPECGGLVRSPDVLLGGTDRCPHCHNAVEVVDLDGLFGATDTASDEGPAMIEHGCDTCGAGIKSPAYLAGEKDICPNCGAEVFVPEDEDDNRLVTRRQYELAKEKLRQSSVSSGNTEVAPAMPGGGDMIGQHSERGRNVLVVAGLAVACIAVGYFFRYATESSGPPEANVAPEAARPADTQPAKEVDAPLALDPLQDPRECLAPAADGTLYYFAERSPYWLVNGRAVPVRNASGLAAATEWSWAAVPDAQGGVYVLTESGPWYIRSGQAKRIEAPSTMPSGTAAPQVSRLSLLWAAAMYHDAKLYRSAHANGEELGRQLGYEDAAEEFGE